MKHDTEFFLFGLLAALAVWGLWLGQACKRYRYDLYAPLGQPWWTDRCVLELARAIDFPNGYCRFPCLIMACGASLMALVCFVGFCPVPRSVMEKVAYATFLYFPPVLVLTYVMGVCNRLGLRYDPEPRDQSLVAADGSNPDAS